MPGLEADISALSRFWKIAFCAIAWRPNANKTNVLLPIKI
jgi:hypothetical protein